MRISKSIRANDGDRFITFYCVLQEPNHGYGIVQKVKTMTGGDIVLAPGTMYGSLSKM